MNLKSNIVSLDEALRSTATKGKTPAASLREAHIPGLMASIQALANQIFTQHLKKMLDKSDDALFDLAEHAPSNAEQNIFFESMREIRLKRGEIEQGFLEQINQSLAYRKNTADGAIFGVSSALTTDKNSPQEKNTKLDNLALMDEEAVEEMLAIDTMSARFENTHCSILVALDARFAHLAGIDASQRGEAKWVNPVSPKPICQYFAKACNALSIDIKARIVLFKLFEKHMSACLGEFYQRTNKQLLQANVLPELPAETTAGKTNDSNRTVKRSETLLASAQNEAAIASGAGFNLFDESRKQFADFASAQSYLSLINANNTPHYAPFLANQISLIPASEQPQITSQSLHTVLHGLQSMPSLQQAGICPSTQMPSITSPERMIKTFLSALLQSTGGQSSIGKQDRDVIGLVSILFKFIIDDRVVAEPMKAAISRMQVPIIKVALNDASFFNQPQHPSRLLLNTMTEATVGWVPHDDWQNDSLYIAICAAVERVITEYEQDIKVFTDVDSELKSFIKNDSKRAEIRKKRVVDAEQGRDQTAMVRAHIDEVISGYLEEGVPEFVESTLRSVWSNWLFIIYHQEGEESSAWQTAVDGVKKLIWTVSPARCAAHRHEMLALLPDLVKLLRSGFDAISYDKQAVASFFEQLEKLHLHVMERLSPIVMSTKGTGIPTVPSLKSQLEAEENSADESLALAASDSLEPQATAHQAQAKALNVGQWVELLDDKQKKTRCRLVAVLRNSGNRIFVNRSGVKAAELSVDDIAHKLQENSIVLLEDAKLFDKALSSIIDSLRAGKKSVSA